MHLKRPASNFWPMVMEGSFMGGGLKFFSTDTVIPLFVAAMGCGQFTIAVIVMIMSFVSPVTAMIVGPYAPFIKNQAWYAAKCKLILRPMPVVLMVPVLLFHMPSGVIAVAICLSLACLMMSGGFADPAATEWFGRMVKAEERDRIYDYQLIFGGVLAVICGLLITSLTAIDMDPYVLYLILFALGGSFTFLSGVGMAFTHDDPNHEPRKLPEHKLTVLKQYYRGIFHYWSENKDFRLFFLAEVFRFLCALNFPYIILMGRSLFGLTETQAASAVLANVAGSIMSGFTWRFINLRRGTKGVAQLSQLFLCLIPILLLISLAGSGIAFIMLMLIECLMGHAANDWVGYNNYMLLIVQKDQIADYTVFRSLLKLPLTIFSLVAGSVIIAVGYWPLTIFCFICAICGVVITLRFNK